MQKVLPDDFILASTLAFTTSRGLLFADDCLRVMPLLKADIVDTVFADPPFNLGKDYKNGYSDNMLQEDYFDWCRLWLAECIRILKPGGALFLYAIPKLCVRFGAILSMSAGMEFRHWIAICMKSTFRRGQRLYPAHYGLLYYTKGSPKTFNNLRVPVPTCRHCGKEIKDYGGHRGKLNPEGLNLTDFWDDTSPNRHRKFKVRQGVNELKAVIPERAILISSNPGDLIFDPFGGGGSTYQAAEKNERFWIGSELFDAAHVEARMREQFPLSVDARPLFDYGEVFIRHENHADPLLRRSKREDMPVGAGESLLGNSGYISVS
ncbi:MAG: site-specific DNA-methyltransferase [Synergistaceae bacterium]|jgi:site-specific DNA-methyltransferase (adenine-specific)|nr:site-specific DNA-methyltransferase [Synergistaceae bacterium]